MQMVDINNICTPFVLEFSQLKILSKITFMYGWLSKINNFCMGNLYNGLFLTVKNSIYYLLCNFILNG